MVFDRTAIISSMLDENGAGLEIGPSHAPLFPKRSGYNVKTLDYASADEIRERFRGHPVNLDAIEDVDYISDGSPIGDIISGSNIFDFIVSSHVIEHVTDFVSYLTSCERLLKEGGKAVLAIPDKRFVFDAFNFPSTTGEVLEAYAGKHRRHAPARIFDFFANTALMDGRGTWSTDDRGRISLEGDKLAEAKTWFERSLTEPKYIDVHAWRLTPASFQLILQDLNALGICGLKVERIEEDGKLEFFACLSHEGSAKVNNREDLLKAIHREQIISSLQILMDNNADSFKTPSRLEEQLSSEASESQGLLPRSGLSGWLRSRLRL